MPPQPLSASGAPCQLDELVGGERLGDEARRARGEATLAGCVIVDRAHDEHLRSGRAAGADARLDRHAVAQLQVHQHEVDRERGIADQLHPRRGAHHDLEVGCVVGEPRGEAVDDELVVVEQREAHPAGLWRLG